MDTRRPVASRQEVRNSGETIEEMIETIEKIEKTIDTKSPYKVLRARRADIRRASFFG